MIFFPEGEMLGEIKVGNPYHGLYQGSLTRNVPGTLRLNNGNTMPFKDISGTPARMRADLECTAFLTKVPGLPAVDPQTGGEVRKNMEWLDYALTCGTKAVTSGVPLTTSTGVVPDYHGSFLYIDSNKAVWQICPTLSGTVTGSVCKVRRFGLIDGNTHSFTNVTIGFSGFKSILPPVTNTLGLVAKNSTGSELIWGMGYSPQLSDEYENDSLAGVPWLKCRQSPVQLFFKMTVSGIGDELATDYGLTIYVDFLKDKLGTIQENTDSSSVRTTITHGVTAFDSVPNDGLGLVPGTYEMGVSAFSTTYTNTGSPPTLTEAAGSYASSYTYDNVRTYTAWAMYDDSDVLHWITTKASRRHTITGSWSSPGYMQNSTTHVTITRSPNSITYDAPALFICEGGVYTVTDTDQWTLQILDNGTVVDTLVDTVTSTNGYSTPSSTEAYQHTITMPFGLYTPPTGTSAAPTHIANTFVDQLGNNQMANSIQGGGAILGLAFHRLAANCLGIHRYDSGNDVSGEMLVNKGMIKYGPISKVLTPTGLVSIDPIQMQDMWRVPGLPTSAGFGVYGTYHPVTHDVAVDTVPVCFI